MTPTEAATTVPDSATRSATGPADGTAIAQVEALFRAEGYLSRIVERGSNRYVHVGGEETDGLVWVRDAGHDSDEGLARFCIDCERRGVAERFVVSTARDDIVEPHAESLGVDFVGPVALSRALGTAGHPTSGEPPERETGREERSEHPAGRDHPEADPGSTDDRTTGETEKAGDPTPRSVTGRIWRRVASLTVL